ncbi:MAG: hypothetical protein MZV65_48265 [Chromatiales bacterium]|nr:hypothetical protein [Chromatiales bacterium]
MRKTSPQDFGRRESRYVTALRGCALLVWSFAATAALAQVVPNAGSALRDVAPRPPITAPAAPAAAPLPPAAPAQPSRPAAQTAFTLRSVSFVGNTVFSSAELAALAADRIGQQVTFAELDQIRQRIADRYREAGYPLAQAVLPVQDVTAGAVEFSIVEGRLGARPPHRRARGADPRPAPRTLPGPAQERAADPAGRAGAHSDADVRPAGHRGQSALEQGEEPGTTDLMVDVGPSPRVNLLLDADNYGVRSTGEQRIGATLRVNGPLGIGDNLDLRLIDTAANGLVSRSRRLRAAAGRQGTRLGVAYGAAPLPSGQGVRRPGQLRFRRSVRDRADPSASCARAPATWSAGRVYEHKLLEDRVGAVPPRFRAEHRSRRARPVLRGAGQRVARRLHQRRRDGAYLGDVDLRSPDVLAVDQAPGGPKTDGSFTHINYQLSRLQALSARTSAYLGLAGQWASKNLVSAEKIALGGPAAVRAYPPSEGVVDEGYVVNGELRFSVTNQITVSGFYDAGWGRILEDPLPGQGTNSATLRGYGLGLYWSAPYGFALRGSAAWRDTGPPVTAPDRLPRVYLQLTKSF